MNEFCSIFNNCNYFPRQYKVPHGIANFQKRQKPNSALSSGFLLALCNYRIVSIRAKTWELINQKTKCTKLILSATSNISITAIAFTREDIKLITAIFWWFPAINVVFRRGCHPFFKILIIVIISGPPNCRKFCSIPAI